MKTEDMVNYLSGLIVLASIIAFGLFIGMLQKNGYAKLLNIPIPVSSIHFFLGPILVLINSAIFLFISAIFITNISTDELAAIQNMEIKVFGGAIFNPFYASTNKILNSVGYAFLIILWWLGMHSFWYSIRDYESSFSFGWNILISAIYLVVGIMSMIALQACWSKFGFEAYKSKLFFGLAGIPIGALLPPILFKLGLPKLF